MSRNMRSEIFPSGVVVPGVLLMVMLLLSSLDIFHILAERQLDDAGDRAFAAFAVARTINGVISVLQEVEFGVSAVVVQTGFQPGQILDPLNDLIERFSNAALIAATLLWSLKILGGLLLSPWIPAVLLLLLGLRVSLENCAACSGIRQTLLRTVRLGIVVWGFGVITPWVIGGIHHSDVVQQHYRHATAEMESASRELGALGNSEAVWTLEEKQVRKTLYELRDMADRLSEQAVIVLAVFVFEVLLIPLLIFWLTSRILLHPPLYRVPPDGSIRQRRPGPARHPSE